MKLLSFLGLGERKRTTYTYVTPDGRLSKETEHIVLALDTFFQPSKVLLFATHAAQTAPSSHLPQIQQCLGNRLEVVSIPDIRSEDDVWALFDACTRSVAQGEAIILDITHAFRSIPLVTFAVAAYLRRVMGVEIRHIVYGAFDPSSPAETPVVDLRPLLDLLDWLHAVHAFSTRCDATDLAHLLREAQARHMRGGYNPEAPHRLISASTKLDDLSRAIHLNRPLEAMEVANALVPVLQDVSQEAARWAKPFRVILDRLAEEVGRFAHPTPEVLDREQLERQWAYIEHCVAKGLSLQAVTLAREWLVSWTMLQLGREKEWCRLKAREEVEIALNSAARHDSVTPRPSWLESLDHADKLVTAWRFVHDLRNDLAHCGMRENPLPSTKAKARVQTMLDHLAGLPV